MTYPPGGTPDPYQPQQPYGQSYDPTTPYPSPEGYAPPAGGAPASGQPYGAPQYPPTSGSPYAQQPYGQPSPYGPAPYAQPYNPALQTNTLAILALVFAFIFSPAAIVLGHVARKQIRQTGEGGDGLATAGLWLGYIFTGLYVVACGLWVVVFAIVGASGATSP
jgi:hypothetical protein